LPVGTVLKNPAYAETLRRIAAGGADAFYRGEIARDVVDTRIRTGAIPAISRLPTLPATAC
jgi:gamma-glutamyltranspeptidase/glutathione hydrolase